MPGARVGGMLFDVVDERSMLRYIRDKTAAPYFSNLVWFIGGHVLELNDCVQHDTEYVTVWLALGFLMSA